MAPNSSGGSVLSLPSMTARSSRYASSSYFLYTASMSSSTYSAFTRFSHSGSFFP